MLSRPLVLGLLISGLSVSLALAQEDSAKDGWRPQFTASVPADKLKAAYPRGATVSGKVALDCVAAGGGKLVDCKVAKEDPAGQGFGAAALSVVGYERIKPKDDAGDSVAGRPVRTYLQFFAPGDANPNWLRKPTAQDIANVFPKKALADGVGGKAVIGCDVTVEGFLQNCKVLSESPKDYAFGAAGLQITPQLRMTPMMRGGKPAPGGTVEIPINWGEPARGSDFNSTPVILDPPWTRVPTQAELNAAWPISAAGIASAQVALRCILAKTGQPRSCAVISEEPRGKGFGRAAQDLSKLFQVNVDPDDKKLRDYKVDVPFRFRDPSLPDNRKLTKPHWIATLTAEGMAAIYPEAAIKAKVMSGQAAATCVVTAEGRLVNCEAARETPVGLDFGAAAIKAATAMRMNPWTKEGDTLDGLKVTVPFQFSFDDAAPAETAKPQGGQP
ncbi:TonB family protein [Caulobacter segnis]|uniref:TonB family protein n=1 Tax=Caulobacter segnis TaxID=88688 RepID=UPI002859AC72|nr:TonB family protein [Caulobacter segnis]MDR6627655.1 TonB family protein [Caulobacter segnis]